MRIISITAGAAGMYCGSCLRDNALAAELQKRGHDVTLVPIYTPTLTDEPNVSEKRVFFGGISVFLQQRLPLFRRTPWLLDRLWDSTVVINALAGRSIGTNPSVLGELTLSMLEGEGGFQKKEIAKLLHWLRKQGAPDVVILPNSLLIGLAEAIKKTLRCPVCCTLQGEDLFLENLHEPYRSRALKLIGQKISSVDMFVAVSEYCARYMSEYLGIAGDKIRVVPLGINIEGYGLRTPAPSQPFAIGYLARIAPEKGLHLLCEAYRLLRHDKGLGDARLEAAGYLGPQNKSYLTKIEQQMKAWGLADEFHYRGVPDRPEKIRFLQSLDVFSVPAPYPEPKGMYVLEAMACGVPVVEPRRGAFAEMIEKTGGGIVVEPKSSDCLAEGILSLRNNPAWAERLGRSGWEGVGKFYTVSQMADRALEVFRCLK